MSYTQLFILNKELKVEEKPEWFNSWLFPPAIYNYLINKYAPEADKKEAVEDAARYMYADILDKEKPLNFLTYFLHDVDNKRWSFLNSSLNKSPVLSDRVGWELIHQQMFRSIDKNVVAGAILQLQRDCDGDEERFREISETIKNIDHEKCPYFILKNTTVDDNVEKYFERHNEELDELEDISLAECEDDLNFGLVVIENGVMSFKDVHSIFSAEVSKQNKAAIYDGVSKGCHNCIYSKMNGIELICVEWQKVIEDDECLCSCFEEKDNEVKKCQ